MPIGEGGHLNASRVKFPPTNEIKRMISACTMAGLPIGPVEFHSTGMTIHPPAAVSGGLDYDQWQASR